MACPAGGGSARAVTMGNAHTGPGKRLLGRLCVLLALSSRLCDFAGTFPDLTWQFTSKEH